jgi:beta-galactosidase/beta-glucuronidase
MNFVNRRSWKAVVSGLIALVAFIPTAGNSLALTQNPVSVSIGTNPNGSYTYLVNGQPSMFVGMGYNPIYGRMPYDQRGGRYEADFKMMCAAGINTITGWDADKGYEQDTFDELTLDEANKYGIGVVMPFFLPVNGDYTDQRLLDERWGAAQAKIAKYKNHPGLRMWGVGNEVLKDMPPSMYPAFMAYYLKLIDLFHASDPNHPVIYRDAEDVSIPVISQALQDSGDPRPWFQYGMNIYNHDPSDLLANWPSYGLNKPLFVSEFGTQPGWMPDRASGYAAMWKSIRNFQDYVLGAAPYAWSTGGPESTDKIWGVMDANSQPVDGTFAALAQLWKAEPQANHSCPDPQAHT